MIVRNATRGLVLGYKVSGAETFRLRLLGLMFRAGLSPGEGLLIRPCRAIHTHFMRFPIDVLFLDGDNRVVHMIPAMAPWKMSPAVRAADAVLELPAGAAGATALGDQLEVI
ncbi:MAG TPA: DUF192 domain-containing protein [Symbiobacteriaceae bacterium]|nr:DUF192 domain-containing protein [Symbiobacteriaceae bacterium]